MWHWRKLVSNRQTANQYRERVTPTCGPTNERYFNRMADNAGKRADFHLSAVQALNDAVWATCEDFPTAEQDCAEEDSNG
jgi:hypothetical protein